MRLASDVRAVEAETHDFRRVREIRVRESSRLRAPLVHAGNAIRLKTGAVASSGGGGRHLLNPAEDATAATERAEGLTGLTGLWNRRSPPSSDAHLFLCATENHPHHFCPTN
ncbi:hypothetical protein G5I_09330 [Acromyrmex echinatior]|uniref:Uncharacterized protein n=1 Tax=Acromyrmex echinatior TaxID=103372 RepID=F4WTX7_ACREC|nr:hypothetical protein G5I_09330 [Acromyrmex echinatior]